MWPTCTVRMDKSNRSYITNEVAGTCLWSNFTEDKYCTIFSVIRISARKPTYPLIIINIILKSPIGRQLSSIIPVLSCPQFKHCHRAPVYFLETASYHVWRKGNEKENSFTFKRVHLVLVYISCNQVWTQSFLQKQERTGIDEMW